jgi:hypothetical protein
MFVKSLLAYPFLGQMYESCPYCGQNFEPETGFYTGAMYFGYAMSVATFLACGLGVFYLMGNPSSEWYVGITVLVVFLVAPLNYRYSRVLMFHAFGRVEYDPNFKLKIEN